MATLTITTTAQQDARIVEAFGKHLGLTDAQGNPRNATGAETFDVSVSLTYESGL